jgi:RNA polymerase sigma-70 factor (ECF subfamily)
MSDNLRDENRPADGKQPEVPGITGFLKGMIAGDVRARDALIARARERLETLTSVMLARFPGVRRFEQTDDVLQNVLIRLTRTLGEIPVPSSSAHWWNIAAQNLRWELYDLARHYGGKYGPGANHHSDGGNAVDGAAAPSSAPSTLDGWTHLHESVERLPEAEREAFELIWYAGLTQEEAAEELGIALRTLRRRWVRARLLLDEAMNGEILD